MRRGGEQDRHGLFGAHGSIFCSSFHPHYHPFSTLISSLPLSPPSFHPLSHHHSRHHQRRYLSRGILAYSSPLFFSFSGSSKPLGEFIHSIVLLGFSPRFFLIFVFFFRSRKSRLDSLRRTECRFTLCQQPTGQTLLRCVLPMLHTHVLALFGVRLATSA
jgi:hypothetical protein